MGGGDSAASSHNRSTMKEASGEEVLSAVETIAPEKKKSFLKAQKQSPDLIWSELGPMRFLTYCNYNYWKAAETLVEYWEKREELFGERAFLPMTLTGKGALTSEDVITVQTGQVACVRTDPNQQPVIFADRNRVLPTSTTMSKLRAAFYMLHEVAKAPVSQTDGCHVLVLVVTPRTSQLDVNFVRGSMQIVHRMPAKVFIHFLTCLPKYGMPPLIQQIVTTAVSYGMTNKEGLKVYSKAVGEPILKELKDKLGLEASDLPAAVGGTWKYENHTLWCRKMAAEAQEKEGRLGRQKETIRVAETQSRKRSKSQTNNNAEDTRKRAKSQNVIHSRLKRERRKAEEQELRSSFDSLRSEQDQLKRENAYLKQLLHRAQSLVQQIEGSGLPNSMFGAMNARNASPRGTAPVATPSNDNAETRNFLPKAPDINEAKFCNPNNQTNTSNQAQPLQSLFASQSVVETAASLMAKHSAPPMGSFSGRAMDPSVQHNQSIPTAAPTADASSLLSSIDLIFRQSADVQRAVLAALQEQIRSRQSVGPAVAPTPQQVGANVPMQLGETPGTGFGRASQLPPLANAHPDILALLMQSQQRR